MKSRFSQKRKQCYESARLLAISKNAAQEIESAIPEKEKGPPDSPIAIFAQGAAEGGTPLAGREADLAVAHSKSAKHARKKKVAKHKATE